MPTNREGRGQATDYVGGPQKRGNEDRMSGTGLAGRKINENEMEMLRKSPELRRHALGPGYGGIINLGSTGYLSCALQLFYLVKPFCEVSQNCAPGRSAINKDF